MDTLEDTGSASLTDSDDISLLSDEEEEYVPPSPPSESWVSGESGPRAWAEVDQAQLRQLAQRIAQRTLPDSDKGHEPLILANTPADGQGLPHDPLGFFSGSSEAGTHPLQPASGDGNEAPGGWGDPRLQPSSPSYDPEIHAIAAYKDIPWAELIRGLDRLRTEVREHTGQLKSLVKENFDRFLSSKDTVDDIAGRLRAAEAEGGAGVHGATPGEVVAGVARSRDASHAMFRQLLERHAKAESLQAMLGMLGEYDSLVGLPAQIRQCTESRDFAGVLAHYKKSIKLVEERGGGDGIEDNHAVWEKLKAEVNKAMASAVHVLASNVSNPMTSVPAAADAAYHLGQLREAGVPAASEIDAFDLLLSAQGSAIIMIIENAKHELKAALSALETEAALEKKRQLGPEIDPQHQQQRRWWWSEKDSDDPSSQIYASNSAYMEILWGLNDDMTAWCIDLWSSTAGKASKESEYWLERRALIDQKMKDVLKIYDAAVMDMLQAQLNSEAVWVAAGSSGVAGALVSGIAAGCVAVQQQGCPPFVLTHLRGLLTTAAEAGAVALDTNLSTSARNIGIEAMTSENSGAVPSSTLMLRLLLCCGMRWATELRDFCAQAGAEAGEGLQPDLLLCSAATAYVESLSDRAQTSLGSQSTTSYQGDHRDRQLLHAWAAVKTVKTKILPQVAMAWGLPLSPKEPSAVRQCCIELEASCDAVVKVYLERKLGVLDVVMEEFLSPIIPDIPENTISDEVFSDACGLMSGWGVKLAPKHPRPVVWSLLGSLGAMRAELLSFAPEMCTEALIEVLHGIVGGVEELLDSGFVGGAFPENILQLWLDVTMLKVVVSKLGDEMESIIGDIEGLCMALEEAFKEGLNRCGEECKAFLPPSVTPAAGDASGWIFKFIKAMRDDQGELLPNAHLIGFFRRICKLLFHNIRPVFIFDGSTPVLKRQTVAERRRRREQQEARVKKTAEKLLLNRLKQHALAQVEAQHAGGTAAAAAGSGPSSTNNPPSTANITNVLPQPPGNQDQGSGAGTSASAAAAEEGARAAATAAGGVLSTEAAAAAPGQAGNAEQDLLPSTENDASLAAFLAAAEPSDSDSEPFEFELPEGEGTIDPVVLSTLPPSMQLEVMLRMRERQMAANRGGFEERTGKPEAFSQFQITQYLKSSNLRHQLDVIRGSNAGANGAARPVAAEESREYVLERDELEGQQAQHNEKTLGALLSAAGEEPSLPSSQPGSVLRSSQGEDMGAGAGAGQHLLRAGSGGGGVSGNSGGLQLSFEIDMEEVLSDNSLDWEDVDVDTIGTAEIDSADGGDGGDQAAEHWRERAARRQKYWSLSHGFRMGKKLAQWGEQGDEEGEAQVQVQGPPGRSPIKSPGGTKSIKIAGGDRSPVHGGGDIVDEDEDAQLQEAIRRSLNPDAVEEAELAERRIGKRSLPLEFGADEGMERTVEVVEGTTTAVGGEQRGEGLIAQGQNKIQVGKKVGTLSAAGNLGNFKGTQDVLVPITSSGQQQQMPVPTTKPAVLPRQATEPSIAGGKSPLGLNSIAPKSLPIPTTTSPFSERACSLVVLPKADERAHAEPLQRPPGQETGAREEVAEVATENASLLQESAAPRKTTTKVVRFTLPEKEEESEEESTWEDVEEERGKEVERIVNDALPLSRDGAASVAADGKGAVPAALRAGGDKEGNSTRDIDISTNSEEVEIVEMLEESSEMAFLREEGMEPSQPGPSSLHVASASAAAPAAPLTDSQQEAAREEYEGALAGAWPEPRAGEGPSQPPAAPAVHLDPEALQREEASLRAEHRAAAGQSDTPTDAMYRDCQELLQLFGLPYLIAPAEAEAQAAWLDDSGLVDAVVTDDNDAFLFGAQRLYRNIFAESKYVEEYRSSELESELGLGRERLVALALLLGSDYTSGVAGVGVVNAVEIVHAFEGPKGLERFAKWVGGLDEELVALAKQATKRKSRGDEDANSDEDVAEEDGISTAEREYKRKHRNLRKSWNLPKGFPSREVIAAYLEPKVDDCKDKFTFARPDLDLLRRFCADKFGWEQSRADELLLPVLKAYDERQTQQTLDNFVAYRQRFAKIRSKRLRKAVAGITGNDNEELALEEEEFEERDEEEAPRPAKKKAAPRKRKAKKLSLPAGSEEDSRDKDTQGGGAIDSDVEIVEEIAAPSSGRGRGRGRGRGGAKAPRRSRKGQQQQAALAAAAEDANNE